MKLSSRLFLALAVAPLLLAQSETQFTTDLLAMNPLGFWPLYGNAKDSTTHANNGALMNGVNFDSFVAPLGTVNSPAAVFARDNDQFVAMPAAGSSIFNLGALHPVTTMAWIKTLNQEGSLNIVIKYDPVAGTGWGMLIDNGNLGGPVAGGHLAFVFAASGSIVLDVESTVAVNDGAWHLVAATYDGSGTASGVHLYVDGVAVATTTLANSIGSASIFNSVPLTIGAASDGNHSFEGNINDVAVFGTALTAAQILQLAEDAVEYARVLPHFVFGGGWYSAVYFTNQGTNQVSFPVQFATDSGTPLNIASIGASSTTITLPPGGTTVIQAPNAGSLEEGYVSMVLPVGVTGYGLFGQSVPGGFQEAVVPLSVTNAGFNSLVYDDTNFVTAVAVANPSAVATTIAITATDIHGNVIGTSTLPLAPFAKTEAVLRTLPGLSSIAGNQGTVQFSTPAQTTATLTGYVAVLGLRFNGLAFTSIPAGGRPGI